MKLKKISGKTCVKILCNKFDFKVIRQKGSHVILRKNDIGVVVPIHKELKCGTLKSILEMAKVSEKDFRNVCKR